MTERCPHCQQEIIPESWYDTWGPPPHYGIGICGCAEGMPVLQEGDILVDRTYHAYPAEITTYGYRAENIMTVQRPNERGVWVSLWTRKRNTRPKERVSKTTPGVYDHAR